VGSGFGARHATIEKLGPHPIQQDLELPGDPLVELLDR
jgi:hypothetical protein